MSLIGRNHSHLRSAFLLSLSALIAAGCSSTKNPTSPTGPSTSSAPYSQTDLVAGTGTLAVGGNRVTVSYTLWLYNASGPNGKGTQVESAPSFSFVLGVGQVIRGWDQGVLGMRVGGQRRLVIPPELAYGASSPGAGIPPNATLVFDITLLAVQ